MVVHWVTLVVHFKIKTTKRKVAGTTDVTGIASTHGRAVFYSGSNERKITRRRCVHIWFLRPLWCEWTPNCARLSTFFTTIEGAFERRLNLTLHDEAVLQHQHHSDTRCHGKCPVPRRIRSFIVLQSQDLSPAASFTTCPWRGWTLKALHVFVWMWLWKSNCHMMPLSGMTHSFIDKKVALEGDDPQLATDKWTDA